MNNKVDRLGVGPKFALVGIAYGVIIFAVHYLLIPSFTFTIIARWVNTVLGIALITVGAPLFLISGIMVHTHIGRGKLCTVGPYAYARHPLYAAWVVFIVPGIVMITGSVIAISLPLFLYFICRLYTREEDIILKKTFGDEYLTYRKQVYSIFPKFWRRYSKADA
jgi:protein-S-isoprenylcysteine O-methyltransferase Ste14